MIDLAAAATGCVEAAAGSVGSLQGSAVFAGGVGVRDSVNGLFGVPKGLATLELDGSPVPTLIPPTVLSIVIVGDSTADRSYAGIANEWVFRLMRHWQVRYDDSLAYAWSFNADAGPVGTGYQSIGPLKLGTTDRLLMVWNPSKGGLSFKHVTGLILADYVVDRNPDIVVTGLGINSYWDPQLASDMQTFVDAVEAAHPSAQIVVSSQNPIAGDSGAPTVRDTVRAVAVANGYLFVDAAYTPFINYGDWESLLKDGTHPTAEGSQLWADSFNARTVLEAEGLTVPGDADYRFTAPTGNWETAEPTGNWETGDVEI